MPKKNPPTGDPILDVLKAERERRCWSQQDLARAIGRQTYQTVWQWENGSNEPKLSNLRDWAAALGYDVTLTARSAETPTAVCGAVAVAAPPDPKPPI
ncbi:helix-turn-helix transcriptional regulator [Micromonospora sp. NPDC053740]|uniref:helix-turn-helix domain-containing protein n=1 Tax=Micromonospora sp. NPDC053740 TaxID=3155173 RepID=UPI003447BA3B